MHEISLAAIELILYVIVALVPKPRRLTPPQSEERASIGGLVGRMNGGRIVNCHSDVKITIEGDPERFDVGGLVGSMGDGSSITGSSANADVRFVPGSLDGILNSRLPVIDVVGWVFALDFGLLFLLVNYRLGQIGSVWRLAALCVLAIGFYIWVNMFVMKFFCRIPDHPFFSLLKLALRKPLDVWPFVMRGRSR